MEIKDKLGEQSDLSCQYPFELAWPIYGVMGAIVVSVNEGEVSFKLTVSPDMAPDVQVVAYAVLPSETVIANSADFSTEQCFSQKVSLRRTRHVAKAVLVRF